MEETSASTRRLPPGSHGIPAEVVAQNQRERLIAAMAEVCGEEGYVGASVERVAKRAGVSSVTFYKQFAGKEDCLLAAHRQLLGRLLEAVDLAAGEEGEGSESDGGGPALGARASLHTALAIFAADPPSARLLTVEVLAAGPEGVKRHDTQLSLHQCKFTSPTSCSLKEESLVGYSATGSTSARSIALAGEGGLFSLWTEGTCLYLTPGGAPYVVSGTLNGSVNSAYSSLVFDSTSGSGLKCCLAKWWFEGSIQLKTSEGKLLRFKP